MIPCYLCRQLVERVVAEVEVCEAGQLVDGVGHEGDGVVVKVETLDVRFLHRTRRHGGQAIVGQVEVSPALIHALLITIKVTVKVKVTDNFIHEQLHRQVVGKVEVSLTLVHALQESKSMSQSTLFMNNSTGITDCSK